MASIQIPLEVDSYGGELGLTYVHDNRLGDSVNHAVIKKAVNELKHTFDDVVAPKRWICKLAFWMPFIWFGGGVLIGIAAGITECSAVCYAFPCWGFSTFALIFVTIIKAGQVLHEGEVAVKERCGELNESLAPLNFEVVKNYHHCHTHVDTTTTLAADHSDQEAGLLSREAPVRVTIGHHHEEEARCHAHAFLKITNTRPDKDCSVSLEATDNGDDGSNCGNGAKGLEPNFCPKCGNACKGMNFCSHCGARL